MPENGISRGRIADAGYARAGIAYSPRRNGRTPGHNTAFPFIPCGMDWLAMLPGGGAGFTKEEAERAREIRLRPGQRMWALLPDGCRWLGPVLTPEMIAQTARALSGHSLAARQGELAAGFLPLPGGHRLGVCGVMGKEGLKEISSLCLRLAHQIKGVGREVFPRIAHCHTLIVGPPGAGKTTLLRDLIRLYGENGVQVGVADERGEIAACREGAPQLDVGPAADVAAGLEKGAAMLLLIRAMAPQVVATDELGGARDARAVREAVQCGVTVLATAHGRSWEDARRLFGEAGPFERLVILEQPGRPPRVEVLSGEEGSACDG